MNLSAGGYRVCADGGDLERYDRAMALVAHDLPPWLCEDEDFLEMLAEVAAGWRTGHPHLFACHGLDREKKLMLTSPVPPIAMREMRAAARELRHEARVGWAVTRVIELAAAIASGPGVHRDVTDAAVRFDDQGRAILLPPLRRVQESLHRTGAGVLKSGFDQLSPEHVRGEALDPRSDVYQLALLLYRLLGAPNPFSAGTELERLQKIVAPTPIPRLDAVGIAVPPPLDDALARALGKQRDGRFDSPTDFARALMPFVESGPTTRIVLADAALELGPSAPLDLFGDHPIRNACPKIWSELTPTNAASVRHCSQCNLDVHRVGSIAALIPVSGSCISFMPRRDR